MSLFKKLQDDELKKINQCLAEVCADFPPYVQEVVSYALLGKGKRLRPLLTISVARLFGYKKTDIYKLAACIELTHSASLLHDDVLDKATIRHDKDAAYLKYGTASVILAGDIMLAKASQIINTFDDVALCQSLANAVYYTSYGEILEIQTQGSLEHGIEKYLEIIQGKTAYLLRTACELGAIQAKVSAKELEAICSFGLNLGLAFQLVDDALDFSEEKNIGKSAGGDIKEGKLTLPIKYYLDTLSPEAYADFKVKFQKQSFSDGEVQFIMESMRNLGLADKTRDFADQFIVKAKEALQKLPQNKINKILEDTVEQLRERKK